MPLTCYSIAAALGIQLQVVERHWPILVAALQERKIFSDLVAVAVAATVFVETVQAFGPVHEYGGKDPETYFTRKYEHRRDLGNVHPGDGVLFHSRGYVPTRGRSAYRAAGKVLGLDLEACPDQVLDPVNAAKVLAHYFWLRHIDMAAEARHWDTVYTRVNDSGHYQPQFRSAVQKLLAALDA